MPDTLKAGTDTKPAQVNNDNISSHGNSTSSSHHDTNTDDSSNLSTDTVSSLGKAPINICQG